LIITYWKGVDGFSKHQPGVLDCVTVDNQTNGVDLEGRNFRKLDVGQSEEIVFQIALVASWLCETWWTGQ
jgi:hypothetical protein